MGASNYRKALWPAWSACSVPCFKQILTDYAPCCAGAANKSMEPSSPKLYLPQILVWFCGKKLFLKVFIKMWAAVFICWRLLYGEVHQGWLEAVCDLLDNPWQNKQLTKTRDLYHRGRKLVSCFFGSDKRKGYAWICLSSSLFMYSWICALTPFSMVFCVHATENSIGTFGGWCWGCRFLLLPLLCSAKSKGCKADMINTGKVAITEDLSVKTTGFYVQALLS